MTIRNMPYSDGGRNEYDRIFRKKPDPITCKHDWGAEDRQYKCLKCGITPIELQQMVAETCNDKG